MKQVSSWISKRWSQLAIWLVSIWLSLLIVIFAPPVAAGFIGVPFTIHVENPYYKVMVGFMVGISAYFLLINLTEVALVLTTIQTKKVVDHFLARVRENMQDNAQDNEEMNETVFCDQY